MRTKYNRGRRIIAAAVLVVVAAAAAFGVAKLLGRERAPMDGEETVTVETRTVDDTIQVTGHLKAREEQDIRAPAAGIVDSVRLSASSTVSKGDIIASLDSTEAAFEVEKIAYLIEQERFAGNLRKIAMLESELAMRRAAVEDLTIRAHLDGKISRLDLKVGDVLKAGDSYGRVIDVRSLVADVEIAEIDIPRAKVGLPVEFRFAALPGLVAKGRLEAFPAEARVNTRGLSVLDAKLVIDAPPEGLLPGYTFDAVITAGEPRDVLVVDSRSVTYRGGRPEVERKRADGGWETLKVVTEGFGSGYVRILDGVVAGDILKVPNGPRAPGQ